MGETMTDLLSRCAEKVMCTFPPVMRAIGQEMRQRQAPELMPVQFFALKILQEHAGASLSLVKQHLCISLSATSKLIDGLVARGLVTREIPLHNRRRIILSLTDTGLALLESHDHAASKYLAERFGDLSDAALCTLIQAMEILDTLFAYRTPAQYESTLPKGEN
jgi:DNA-binding MarR family transcriptional regulator